MVQAIAKRRQLPTSGTPMESLESTRGVSRPGPNSSAAFAAGKEMTLTSLSVSSAKRTGPGAFSGATIHAGRASAPDGRNATAVAGPPTAAATCAGSHSGMARTAASPERKAGGGPGSTSVSPNASRSSAARRSCAGRRTDHAGDDEVAGGEREEERRPAGEDQGGPFPPGPGERDDGSHDGHRGDDGGAGNAGRQRRLIYDAMESTHDLRRIESRSQGKDQCEAGKQHAQVPPRVIAGADAAVPDAQ